MTLKQRHQGAEPVEDLPLGWHLDRAQQCRCPVPTTQDSDQRTEDVARSLEQF